METHTLTFGNRAENHKGMQIIGKQLDCGLSHDDLINIQKEFDDAGYETKLINLNELLNVVDSSEDNTTNDSNESNESNDSNDSNESNDSNDSNKSTSEELDEDNTFGVGEIAELLIIRKGIDKFVNSAVLFTEQRKLKKDTQAYMYGRVVNKKARYNLCFSDFSQQSDYPNKKGTVYNFSDKQVKTLNRLRTQIGDLHPQLKNLQCEGNYYYDVKKTFIGFHGDAEREIVVGCRLGADFPFYYKWYKNNSPCGELLKVILSHGDMYIMSDKAVGRDWKKSSIYTLRHAAGPENLIGLSK